MARFAFLRYDGRDLVAVFVPDLQLELLLVHHGGAHLLKGKRRVFYAAVQGVHVAVGGVEDFVLESPVGNEHQSVIVVEAEGVAVVVQLISGRRPGN